MPFIPHTESDIRAMLASIGAPSTDALFDEIPAELNCGGLPGIPEGLSEMRVTRLMQGRAVQDGFYSSFIGAGAYEHHIPAAVWSASFSPPTRRIRPRPVRARCNCSTNTRP